MTTAENDPLSDLARHRKLGPEWNQAEGEPLSNVNYVYTESDPGSRADHVRTRLKILKREWDPTKYVFLLPDFPHDLDERAKSFRVLVCARKEAASSAVQES